MLAAPVAGDIAEQVDGPFADPVVEGERIVPAPRGPDAAESVGVTAPPAAGVVLRPALGIDEKVVGFADLAETVGGRPVVRLRVGVKFLGERAVGALHLVERRTPLDAEHCVRILHAASIACPLVHALPRGRAAATLRADGRQRTGGVSWRANRSIS